MVMIFSCLIDDDFFCRVMLSPSGPPYPPRRNVGMTKGRTADVTVHMEHADSTLHRTSHSTLSAGEKGVIARGGEGGTVRGRSWYADDLEAPVWVPATFAVRLSSMQKVYYQPAPA